MNDIVRRPDQVSPKSSPRGGISPAYPRQDSSGTLKTTISLGKNPSVISSGNFYLLKQDLPEQAEITGSTNLMEQYGLQNSYYKFCNKKGKEELSAFLPQLPGNIDTPGLQDNSSLQSLIEKPPIIGKELVPLSGQALSGFRLHPGPLPEQYRFMNQMTQKKKHKNKKHKKEPGKEGALHESQADNSGESTHDKKPRKGKKIDEESRAERRKKKKEKKKKKKHSPEHPSQSGD